MDVVHAPPSSSGGMIPHGLPPPRGSGVTHVMQPAPPPPQPHPSAPTTVQKLVRQGHQLELLQQVGSVQTK